MPSSQLYAAPPPTDAARALATDWGAPVAFDDVFGFLHPAAGHTGAVIVPHWGYDGLCFHPMPRALAAALAQAGVPCLRYDPPGEGHSSDLADDADPARAWARSVVAAAAALRAQSGARRVVLIGFGLGAAAAALASDAVEGIAGAALVAPWLSGRRALRELSAGGRMAAEAMGIAPDAGAPGGGLAVAGFALTKAQREALARVEIDAAALAACPHALIVARPEQAAAGAALAQALGPERARLVEFEGYDKAAFDPSNFVMPQATLARIVDWARGFASPAPEAAPAAPARPRRRAGGVEEEAARFGPQGRLFGVLATPLEGRPRAAALLLNAGRNRCIGWARGDVAEARRLARAGVAVLRFDLAGVGDSAPENADEPLYDARRAVDVSAAIDFLEGRLGPLPVALRGPCSGAFLGFAAAVADPRVRGAALINAQRYVWNPNDDFDVVMRQPVHSVALAREARDLRHIRRLLRGEITPASVARRLGGLVWRGAQARLGRLGLPVTAQARIIAEGRRGFAALAARDMALKIVVSQGDRAIDELKLFFGDEAQFARAHGGDALIRIANADHNLTDPQARRAASDAFDAVIARIALR